MQCCYLRMSNVYHSCVGRAILICFPVKESACRGYTETQKGTCLSVVCPVLVCSTCTAHVLMRQCFCLILAQEGVLHAPIFVYFDGSMQV